MKASARRGNPGKPIDAVLVAAAGHVAAGRYRAAVRELDKHGAALRHPTGQNILGNAHLRAGKPVPALAAFEAAIGLAPQFPEAHCNRGVALEALGRLDEALAALDRAIAMRPAYPLAHFNRGNVLKAMGQPEPALAAYEQACRLEPGFAEAHLSRGFALLTLGRSQEALQAFDAALRLRPGLSEAAIGRGAALDRLNRPAEALAAVDMALGLDPDSAEALAIRGDALAALRRREEARAAYERSLARLPDTAAALVTRTRVLVGLERYGEALAAADRAVSLGAGADGQFARASALRGLGRLAEQLDALDAAAKLGKTGNIIQHARAVALAELGRSDEAGAAFEAAIASDPGDARSHYDFSHLLLYRGAVERGWKEHEYRLRLPNFGFGSRTVPRWQGEDIAGQRLLVHAEQGIGDAIQMVRYLGRVGESGARITLAVHAPLRRLLAANFANVEVIDMGDDRDDFDRQVSLMSLPHVFATRLDTIPATVPYLFAEDGLVDKWRERIGTEGFKIGICWTGNPDYRADRYRSMPLDAFAPLGAIPDMRLISLQALHGLDQLERLPAGMAVESLGDEIADNPDGLAEIAGLTASLDLVISADTAVAHLAGALGRPVWTAIRFQPEWRWLEGRNDPPWYPTMWLFRQPVLGDWDSVFAEMAGYLEQFRRESG